MKGAAITNKGIENICADEIKELIGKQSEIRERVVIFDLKEFEELCHVSYKSQSATRVILYLGSTILKNLDEKFEEELAEIFNKSKLFDFLKKETSFKVECERAGEHDFSSVEAERFFGEILHGLTQKKHGKANKVDLENPQVTIFVNIFEKNCVFGVDFSGQIEKRQYKIFSNKESIKGNVAFSLVKLAKYNKKDIILDPFCKSGEILIEAALYLSGKPVNFYNKDALTFMRFEKEIINSEKFFKKHDCEIKQEKVSILGYDSALPNVIAARKDAKIAGIEKLITFSRYDIEWIDTKFKKNSVDKVITRLPVLGKASEKILKKIYNDFFDGTEYILKDKGIIVCLSENEDLLVEYSKKKFEILEKIGITTGKKVLNAFVLKKV